MRDDYSRVSVFCDKPSDAKLFKLLKRNTPLEMIYDTNVSVLPSRNSMPAEYRDTLLPLLEFDRADYYFCWDNKPVVIVEATEHGYTGDQCMQRFARVARTASLRVPFIYFAPEARSRYDELDLGSSRSPSRRRVSAEMYKGFVRLMDIYQSPVVALPWETDSRGIPMVLAATEQSANGLKALFELVGKLLVEYRERILEKRDLLGIPVLKQHVEHTIDLSNRDNVRSSDVRHEHLDFDSIDAVMRHPGDGIMSRAYFFSGKAHKLLALRALECSTISAAILPSGDRISYEAFLRKFSHVFENRKWLYYYLGYQWRGEPNIGIITNTDIVYCRNKHGASSKDRTQLLCVHWPRVFFNEDNPIRENLLQEIADPVHCGEYQRLAREGMRTTGSSPNLAILPSDKKNYGVWSDRASVARVFRETCDLIILNDVVIVGNNWDNV